MTAPVRRLCIVLVAAVVLMSGSGAVFAALEEVPDYEHLGFSTANVKAFVRVVTTERADYCKELQAKYPDKPEKVKANAELVAYDKIIADAQKILAGVQTTGETPVLARAFDQVQRLHYGILASLGRGADEPRLQRKWRLAVNMVGGRLMLAVPNVINPNYPIGRRKAQEESDRLYTADGKGPLTVEQLAKLSAHEVSRLQPIADHTAIKPVAPGDHFGAFLDEQLALIRAQSPALAKFDFGHARRVVFFDSMNAAATSPKIMVKDRFGMKWMLKWGDEVHTDNAVSRLYIDLGATFTDIKFYAGPGETTLVLAAPGDKSPEAVKTWAQLSKMLLESSFAFHADRYLVPSPVLKDKQGNILGTGQIDAAMAETNGLDPKFVGAYFVKFKENLMSFFNPAIKRLGGTSLSNLGAENDRVARGSLVFNCWIKNKDMKDENSRVGLVFNPETGEFDRKVEYQCDLGCTLGATKPSGELNSYEKEMVMLFPQSINFIMRPLYIPKAWKKCTWSDARWMAMRIAGLSRADIERDLSESGWPPFAQKVAVERLLNRRNELVKHFKLEADGFKMIPCDPDFDLVVKTKKGDDFVVKNGAINKNSPTVQATEAAYHPEGLAEIISRKND